MSVDTASMIAGWLGLYFGAGLIFALLFVWLGLGRVDAAARNASFATRVLFIPGVTGLWPLMALKWLAVLFRKSSGVNP